jgi:hypothetical protein
MLSDVDRFERTRAKWPQKYFQGFRRNPYIYGRPGRTVLFLELNHRQFAVRFQCSCYLFQCSLAHVDLNKIMQHRCHETYIHRTICYGYVPTDIGNTGENIVDISGLNLSTIFPGCKEEIYKSFLDFLIGALFSMRSRLMFYTI